MAETRKAELASTGIPDLDRLLQGVYFQDNVVWKVNSIDEYRPFVTALADYVKAHKERLFYFRFASHPPLLTEDSGAIIRNLSPEAGFEHFITFIHDTIRDGGKRAFYVFDAISDLGQTWYSDRMIGNFFKLTCPYLYAMDTVAYFALYRNHHSYHAMQPITETTQILLDLYPYKGKTYILPCKVDGRHSPTMFTMHVREGDRFIPITNSHRASEVLAASPWHGLRSASYRMVGIWDHTFLRAENLINQPEAPSAETRSALFQQLAQLIISREKQILELAEKYLTVVDIIQVWKRMIGTGMIGGKAVGMLLARAILAREAPDLAARLEPHDSFFIGADVFYTYLVENKCWHDRQRQKNPETFLEGIDEARERLMKGKFPDYILARFSDLLDYYGQSPIIVRSSSLQEDNYGNAFAGKYDSVFCANQGTKAERMEEFLSAVRLVYASTMNETALKYRQQRGVLDLDEQMALLVQRVSGSCYDRYFFPQLAGVAFSFNPYVWNRDIDPEAGVVRLVFGLGTRAVDRADDDYTRVVALNCPLRRPESNLDDVKRFSQRRLDVLDLEQKKLRSLLFDEVSGLCGEEELDLFVTRDHHAQRLARESGRTEAAHSILTFDRLLKNTPFAEDLRRTLAILRTAYGRHVDVEFTANFVENSFGSFNVLQCRPLQVQTDATMAAYPRPRRGAAVLLRAHGGVIGHSRRVPIERVVYVVPELYGQLSESDKYAVARLVGKLSKPRTGNVTAGLMLIGPGRWGTSTPSLGVPVSFAEIAGASVLCEVNIMHDSLVPDLSLGTHFFNEMVEMNILYIAYFAERSDNRLDRAFFEGTPNRLKEILPEAEPWEKVVRVMDGQDAGRRKMLCLYADSVGQTAELMSIPTPGGKKI